MRWEEVVNCCCHTLAGTVKPGAFFFFSFKRKYFRINYLPYIVTQLARCLCMYGLRVSGLYPFFLCGWYGENAFQCVPCTLASFGLMTTESVGSIEL